MNDRRELIIGIVLAAAAALGYGSTEVLIKRGVAELAPPLVGAATSLFGGVLALGLYTARSPEGDLKQKRGAVGLLLLAGAIAAGGVAFRYLALSLAPVVMVSPIVSTSPLFALLWSRIFLGGLERITRRIVLGAVLVVAGAILIIIGGEV